MYKVRIMISIFLGMPRKIPGSYTLVAGFLICQYTFQYTSCILCITGGILGGIWKVSIRNFTVVVGFLLVQAICQYTVCILGKSRDILNVVWKESALISYILWIMTPGFQLEWNLFSGLLVTGFLGIQISDLKMLPIKHHFYRFLPCYFF